MNKAAFSVVAAGAIALGLACRVPRLDLRPMHHDEANQAVRFGQLLETGEYRYDPVDHHGPTLYYLTLPAAWARGQTTLAALDERTLRVVPVAFGVGFILLLPLLARGLGRGAAATAALLAALSPALTYYSRFYIQESVLLFFAVGFVIALGRYVTGGGAASMLAAAGCAGLALATKETALPILLAAMAACAVARASVRNPEAATSHEAASPWPRIRVAQPLGALALTALLVVALYSSFFTNLAGVADAIRAFTVYVQRGLAPGTHGERWDYYLRLLWYSSSGGIVWSEGVVLVLALTGGVFAWRSGTGGFWPRYVCLYSAVTLAAFSAVPYKTPWNLLPFYGGLVALAGYGGARLLGSTRPRTMRALLALVLLTACGRLGFQNWLANFRYPADPRNPYVYAQTSPDFLRLVTRVTDVSSVHPDRERMLVAVVAGPYEQWPLPWYLRRMTRVGYWTSVAAVGPLDRVPFIVAAPDFADAVAAPLGDRYVSEYYGLRPGVLLTVFIERGLWERYLARSDPNSR
jgi:uncharacterized protein (TIGR03663 family)